MKDSVGLIWYVWGGAKEAMKAEGHIIQDYQFLYPIPKTELERINNTELLWQNTGY